MPVKFLFVFIFSFLSGICLGQINSVISIGIPTSTADKLIYTHHLADSVTCDRTLLNVAYKLSFRPLPEQQNPWEDLIVLQIGTRLTKQFSAWAYQIDSAMTMRHRYGLSGNWMGPEEAAKEFAKIRAKLPLIPAGQLWFGLSPKGRKFTSCHSELFKFRGTNHFTIIQPEPESDLNGKGFVYEDIPPALQWNINYTDSTEIAGYRCRKATTRFRGRTYTAWYAVELPFSEGPYKFGGLPGLILQIEDDAGEYRWNVLLIDTHERPIVRYAYDYQRTTRRNSGSGTALFIPIPNNSSGAEEWRLNCSMRKIPSS